MKKHFLVRSIIAVCLLSMSADLFASEFKPKKRRKRLNESGQTYVRTLSDQPARPFDNGEEEPVHAMKEQELSNNIQRNEPVAEASVADMNEMPYLCDESDVAIQEAMTQEENSEQIIDAVTQPEITANQDVEGSETSNDDNLPEIEVTSKEVDQKPLSQSQKSTESKADEPIVPTAAVKETKSSWGILSWFGGSSVETQKEEYLKQPEEKTCNSIAQLFRDYQRGTACNILSEISKAKYNHNAEGSAARVEYAVNECINYKGAYDKALITLLKVFKTEGYEMQPTVAADAHKYLKASQAAKEFAFKSALARGAAEYSQDINQQLALMKNFMAAQTNVLIEKLAVHQKKMEELLDTDTKTINKYKKSRLNSLDMHEGVCGLVATNYESDTDDSKPKSYSKQLVLERNKKTAEFNLVMGNISNLTKDAKEANLDVQEMNVYKPVIK